MQDGANCKAKTPASLFVPPGNHVDDTLLSGVWSVKLHPLRPHGSSKKCTSLNDHLRLAANGELCLRPTLQLKKKHLCSLVQKFVLVSTTKSLMSVQPTIDYYITVAHIVQIAFELQKPKSVKFTVI